MTPILERCRLVDLGKIEDARGNLTFIEGNRHIPFEIERVYYLYDVPSGAERGGHGHKALRQFLIALAGSFDVTITDGLDRRVVQLNRPNLGLYICPMIWRELSNFSAGSVCLVLASSRYDEADYYRAYPDYVEARERGHFLENAR